jgi:acyl-CoA dehydrogenase
VPITTPTKRYYQNINRYSAAFALATDFAMLTLGGKLKIKELLSARLGDVLSSMYLASTVLKHFENQGRPTADLPLVEWSIRTLMYNAQEQLHSFLRNFPNRPVAFFLRCFIFPRGRTYFSPSDDLARSVVDLVTHSGAARERLCQQAYTTLEPGNPLGLLQEALELTEKYEPLETRLRQARKEGLIRADYFGHQIGEAEHAKIISGFEAADLRVYHEKVLKLLAVDDFSPDAFKRSGIDDEPLAATPDPAPTARRAAAKKPSRKRSAARTAKSVDRNSNS